MYMGIPKFYIGQSLFYCLIGFLMKNMTENMYMVEQIVIDANFEIPNVGYVIWAC